MEYRFRISQNELASVYDNAQARMNYNPKVAEKHKTVIASFPFFKNEKEVLQATLDMMNKKFSNYQIWAKISKTDEYYYIQDYFIATDDNLIKQSAEYIGMALIYDETRLLNIIDNGIPINEIVAY